MAKDTFYFSHDYNARNDAKIKKLLSRHGYLGYGIFWAIIEDLYNNANALPLDCESIAFDLRTSKNIVESIINDFDLFVIENDVFGSHSIQKRLEERDAKSIKARESAFKRWNKDSKDANALPTQSDCNAIKESKVKEIKESIDNAHTSLMDIQNTFNFKASLVNYGFKIDIVEQWLKVRKNKKATNSQIAFKQFIKEIELNGSDKNLILEKCVEKSWSGFESDWYKKTPQIEKMVVYLELDSIDPKREHKAKESLYNEYIQQGRNIEFIRYVGI